MFLDGTDPQIYSKPQSTDDNLYDALKLQKEDYDTLSANYQFVSLIEKDTSETFTKGGEREPKLQPCTPFDKYDAKDEEANSKHKKDSYVRNDKQAKEYRDLLKLLNTLFDVPNTNDFTAVQ